MNIRPLSAALAVVVVLVPAARGNMDSPIQVHATPPPVTAVDVAPPSALPGGTPLIQTQGAETCWRDPFSIDIHGFYGIQASGNSYDAPDIWGLEAEVAWYFSPRQAITFAALAGWGSHGDTNFMMTEKGNIPVSEDFTRFDCALMLGYRFTQALTDNTSLSFGLKGGLDIQELSYDDVQADLKDEGRWVWDAEDNTSEWVEDSHRYGHARCGFAYAASVTLETRLSEHVLMQVGYQYRGTTTEARVPSAIPGGSSHSAPTLRCHEIHAGLRIVF